MAVDVALDAGAGRVGVVGPRQAGVGRGQRRRRRQVVIVVDVVFNGGGISLLVRGGAGIGRCSGRFGASTSSSSRRGNPGVVLLQQPLLPLLVVRVGRHRLDNPHSNLERIAQRLEGDGVAITTRVGHGPEVGLEVDAGTSGRGVLSGSAPRDGQEVAVQFGIHPDDVEGEAAQFEIGPVIVPEEGLPLSPGAVRAR